MWGAVRVLSCLPGVARSSAPEARLTTLEWGVSVWVGHAAVLVVWPAVEGDCAEALGHASPFTARLLVDSEHRLPA